MIYSQVGLAVGDTQVELEKATLTKLSLQVLFLYIMLYWSNIHIAVLKFQCIHHVQVSECHAG